MCCKQGDCATLCKSVFNLCLTISPFLSSTASGDSYYLSSHAPTPWNFKISSIVNAWLLPFSSFHQTLHDQYMGLPRESPQEPTTISAGTAYITSESAGQSSITSYQMVSTIHRLMNQRWPPTTKLWRTPVEPPMMRQLSPGSKLRLTLAMRRSGGCYSFPWLVQVNVCSSPETTVEGLYSSSRIKVLMPCCHFQD